MTAIRPQRRGALRPWARSVPCGRARQTVVAVALTLGLIAGSAAVAHACNNAFLNGVYDFTLAGVTPRGNVFSALGIAVLNGAGSGSISGTANERFVGQNLPLAATASYFVGADCNVSIALYSAEGQTTYFGRVLFGGILVIFADVTDPGQQAAGTAFRR